MTFAGVAAEPGRRAKVKAAIIGSGNIGTDLMIKIMRTSNILEMGALIGIDANSDGLKRAERLGVATTHEGIEGAQKLAVWPEIGVIFDATSAKAHEGHSRIAAAAGKLMIDLTPAAIGPYVVPVVNGDTRIDAPNVNMVTCGGRRPSPWSRRWPRSRGCITRKSLRRSPPNRRGPERAPISMNSRRLRREHRAGGGAERGKAIIILNPAEPPMIMRDTVFTLSSGADEATIEAAIDEMVAKVQDYVPGYRLKQRPQFERFGANNPVVIPGHGAFEGIKTSVFLEVEGAAHYLPAYAGNLDIMTSAGLRTAEKSLKAV